VCARLKALIRCCLRANNVRLYNLKEIKTEKAGTEKERETIEKE